MNAINKKNATKKVSQFNLDHLNHHRAPIIGKGWADVKIDPDFLEWSINETVKIIGGNEATKEKIKFILKNTPVNHWSLQKFIFSNYESGARWSYCAGQDYTGDICTIRNFLRKL